MTAARLETVPAKDCRKPYTQHMPSLCASYEKKMPKQEIHFIALQVFTNTVQGAQTMTEGFFTAAMESVSSGHDTNICLKAKHSLTYADHRYKGCPRCKKQLCKQKIKFADNLLILQGAKIKQTWYCSSPAIQTMRQKTQTDIRFEAFSEKQNFSRFKHHCLFFC